MNTSVAAAVTVPDTEPAASWLLFLSIVTEAGTTSSSAHEFLGGFSSITRLPRYQATEDRAVISQRTQRETSPYLFWEFQHKTFTHLHSGLRALPVTGAVLFEEDVRTSWGEVKPSLSKQSYFLDAHPYYTILILLKPHTKPDLDGIRPSGTDGSAQSILTGREKS